MSWKRARNDEQKEERIREVIEASLCLYGHMTYDQITYGLIAKEAGWARSNLYKYF